MSDILTFLQEILEGGKAISTIKVYLVAISSCHMGFNGETVGKHSIVSRFLKGVRHLRPITKPMLPAWDLPLVLEALGEAPFEALEPLCVFCEPQETATISLDSGGYNAGVFSEKSAITSKPKGPFYKREWLHLGLYLRASLWKMCVRQLTGPLHIHL